MMMGIHQTSHTLVPSMTTVPIKTSHIIVTPPNTVHWYMMLIIVFLLIIVETISYMHMTTVPIQLVTLF